MSRYSKCASCRRLSSLFTHLPATKSSLQSRLLKKSERSFEDRTKLFRKKYQRRVFKNFPSRKNRCSNLIQTLRKDQRMLSSNHQKLLSRKTQRMPTVVLCVYKLSIIQPKPTAIIYSAQNASPKPCWSTQDVPFVDVQSQHNTRLRNSTKSW